VELAATGTLTQPGSLGSTASNYPCGPHRMLSPELNPVERIWLYLRERFLSLRFLPDTEAIIEACCRAWNALTAEPDRVRSLCTYPWITKVAS
jgi:hypothetical protein